MTELQDIEDEMRRAEDPIVTVPELADRLDASDTHVRGQLRLLERAGAVESKDTGARATAWWHEDRVRPPRVDPADHPDQTGHSTHAAREQSLDDADDDHGADVEQAVAGLDLPGEGRRLDQRREAVVATLRHLRDAGETTASELRELIHEHHETGYASPRSWWKNCASQALSDLCEDGVVELVDSHDGVWKWTGDGASEQSPSPTTDSEGEDDGSPYDPTSEF